MSRIVAALLALATLGVGVLLVSSAGAHTPATFEFTNKAANTKITSTADGTGAQSHHVIDLPGAGQLTCKKVTFEGTAKATKVTTIRMTAAFSSCTLAGIEATVSMQGCEFVFGADGSFQISSAPGKNCTNEPIDISNSDGCHVWIPEQSLTGLSYTNINPSGKNEEVTMSMAVPKIAGTTQPGCEDPGDFTAGEYTTGNTILTGQEDPGANMIPMKRIATVP